MGKNLGGAIIDLLDSDKVELRAAATTVLAAVGKGDKSVMSALTSRLGDADNVVRRIALEGLADLGASGIAANLVPLLRGDDDTLAERAATLLAQQGAEAESTLRKEVRAGSVGARRVMAQLLLRRGTQPAIDAVLDQLSDHEFGEQALQLVRAELDKDNEKLANQVEKSAIGRAGDAAKELHKAWSAAEKTADKVIKQNKDAAKKAVKKKAANGTNGHGVLAAPKMEPGGLRPTGGEDPLRDPEVAGGIAQLGALLRLIGYLARPSTQSLLLKYADADEPRPIRLAAIAGLRRIVATSEAKGTEKVIETLIDYADSDDFAVAQSAVDTLRGARIPESLAKAFAGLAKSKNVAAQKLAMERMPAGGGASAVKMLIEALGGDDPTARDAAARGLAKAPESVMPLVKALLDTDDEQIARRYAGVIRSHRGNVSNAAIEQLVDRLRELSEKSTKGKAEADAILVERVLGELIADVAPHKHVEMLFERAKRLRKAGKPVEAFGSLKPLMRSRADLDAAIDDDQRFFLAMLSLEVAGEGIVRSTHADDPVFAQFAVLAAKGYPVAKQLAKSNDITDEILYGLGFRLIESGDASNEELGAELLQGIIDERPRSKLAKAAKNKLKLTGHLDDD
ncbi:MAG TPA: HEAT repeat domain-containing protein [Kofleriaceae bacterium]|nr:HEAT repeat domain-containing protein [Kofleriaceae bacterium]